MVGIQHMFAVILSQVLGKRFPTVASVDLHSSPARQAFLSNLKAEKPEARGV